MKRSIKNTIFLTVMALFTGLIGVGTVSAQLLINEIEADPGNQQNDSCQYVELKGEPGSTVPANTWFVAIDSDSGFPGTLNMAVNVGGQVVGSNGTLTLLNTFGSTCPNRTYGSGTTVVNYSSPLRIGGGNVNVGSESFGIINTASNLIVGSDADSDDDGVLNFTATFIDAVAFIVNPDEQNIYPSNAPILGTPFTDVPDALVRFCSNTTTFSGDAYYWGEVAESPDESTQLIAPLSANFPVGGGLSPGDINSPCADPTPTPTPTMTPTPTPTPTVTPTPTPTPTVTPTPTPTPQPSPRDAIGDFNGDGKTDFSVTRTVEGALAWFSLFSGTSEYGAVAWGAPGDIHTPEDFDGDGKDEQAVWRANEGGESAFYILQSSNFTFHAFNLGRPGDDPTVVGDWDGDGIADAAVFRDEATASTAAFYVRLSGSGSVSEIPWGAPGDRPIRADFDGDEKIDPAVFRPSTGVWYVLQSSDLNWFGVPWGMASDKIVIGDFDNDGKNDPTVVRDGFWYVLRSSDLGVSYYHWGFGTDVPVAGDYDGDGATDPAVWRDGTFYVSGSMGNMIFVSWGIAGDYPVVSTFNR